MSGVPCGALARTPDRRTERPLGPASAGLGWLFDWRWIAPVATVAVFMLAVWVIEPGSPARQEGPTLEEAELAPRATPARARNESADRQARRDDLSTAPLPAEERFAEAPAEAPEDAPSAQTAENRSRVQRRENALTETDTVQVDEVEDLVQRYAAATAAASDRLEDLAKMERPEPAPERRIAAEALASRGAAVADTFSLVDADATVVIATPTASIVWRILRPGSIERSSDGGSTRSSI